ncbi:hypothetical protein QM265_19660, partial [Acinetobacter nosocomialis]|uniref:hypothetical protein n=1 Tax=Acinetobacter nosocomialis TaxID=106654 RepID=UPI0024B83682
TTIVLPGCLGPSNPGSPVSGARHLAADAGRRMQPASRFVLRFARSNSWLDLVKYLLLKEN